MNIKHLLSDITTTTHSFEVSGLSLNSQTLKKGDVFVALQGEKNHGSAYIDNAIENGCIAVLIEGKEIDCTVPAIEIDDLKAKLSALAENFYTHAKKVRSYCGNWNKWKNVCKSFYFTTFKFLTN